ncbi:flagellar biosynthesis protein FlhA (plasmid) [Arthrobacter sp. ERGS1:01]|uniref:flagellar biosynthesis protein FlhA n=1 Tax=Arthrobacter sp. ERGS1:01 TaxID=1704044 RepID=UPI0006B42206|nr:flagellar biosynthesis protein FlhA [Arthrobacter sp. ERGS1:01]ALE04218.1 flagellar biosynthesis protein FlhA [Arthrobacter sp. ERGS1:01]
MAIPMGVVGIVLLLVVPIPTLLLDVLIIINIVFALLVLMNTMFVKKPLDFSVFPSLLLVATLFRLGLNVASTRLVLGQAHAGQVIQAFGEVTVGGNLIIGAVIFLILVVIQFVVVTKGAERVAEVGARFTLDAMPGKQMAIDADLNAGLITDVAARERRAEVSAEADFYGAMDGASKFVKGDAIVGIIIIIINLVGGIAIGMGQRGMDIADALNTYSLLSMGDGLVSQIPALLMAVATGMIVTRSNASSDMGTTAAVQLTQSRPALMVAGIAAIIMAVIPGMPVFLFLAVGAILLVIGQRVKAAETKAATAAALAALPSAPRTETTEDILEQMRVQPLEIQLATDLVDLVSGSADDLLARIRALRHKVAMEMGIVVPPVRTRDHVELPPSTYVIRIAGVEAGRGTAPAGRVLALGDNLACLPGTPTVEPVFGLAGKWVPAEMRHSAEMAGATVVDRVSVLVTHLSSVVSANAARLLSREDVRVLTEGVKEVSPSIVEDLIPGLLSLGEVQSVLQGLLVEQVPINDLPRIYEALSLQAKKGSDTEGLVEAARTGLGPVIADKYLEGGTLAVLMIDPTLEQGMLEGLRPSDLGTQIVMDANRLEAVLTSVGDNAAAAEASGRTVVLVCAPALRPAIRRLVAGRVNGLPVLSYTEATAGNPTIETLGVVRGAQSISA